MVTKEMLTAALTERHGTAYQARFSAATSREAKRS